MKVEIKQRTGHYNWADPSDEGRYIDIKIPDEGFDETISYREPYPVDVRGTPWHEAIVEIINSEPWGIRAKRTYLPELRQIYNHRGSEIRAAWEEHRMAEIKGEIERLHEELMELE